jgi:transcriptional regulator with XRE-family HTH domain
MAENRRLAAARVLKGITQRQLAELVGTREIEISRIETGRCEPHGQMKERIAAVLEKPTFELFDC